MHNDLHNYYIGMQIVLDVVGVANVTCRAMDAVNEQVHDIVTSHISTTYCSLRGISLHESQVM
ncbi:MAG: hypothetical protein GQ583_11780 [Methyloprofundus sp.]|nr:hypothetical protein [Methyloprofundus sp.]